MAVVEKDFVLMFNQFDGNEASKHEILHDIRRPLLIWFLFFFSWGWSQNRIGLWLNASWHTFFTHAWPPTGHFPHVDRVAEITRHGSPNMAGKGATKVLRSKQGRNGGWSLRWAQSLLSSSFFSIPGHDGVHMPVCSSSQCLQPNSQCFRSYWIEYSTNHDLWLLIFSCFSSEATAQRPGELGKTPGAKCDGCSLRWGASTCLKDVFTWI